MSLSVTVLPEDPNQMFSPMPTSHGGQSLRWYSTHTPRSPSLTVPSPLNCTPSVPASTSSDATVTIWRHSLTYHSAPLHDMEDSNFYKYITCTIVVSGDHGEFTSRLPSRFRIVVIDEIGTESVDVCYYLYTCTCPATQEKPWRLLLGSVDCVDSNLACDSYSCDSQNTGTRYAPEVKQDNRAAS